MKHSNHFQTYKPAPETRPEPPAWVIWAGAFCVLVALYLLTVTLFSL
jgi:hypothetical protein